MPKFFLERTIRDKIITLHNFSVSELVTDITLHYGASLKINIFAYMIFWFFREGDGRMVRGEVEEKEKKKEKQKQRQNHTEPRYITSHTAQSYFPFLSTSVLFLMVHGTLLVVFW